MAENYWQNLGRRRYGRRTVLAASGGAGALMLAGCGDDDDDTPATQAPGGSTPGASAPAATPTPVDLSKLSEEEFLKRIPENPPKTWKDEDIKAGGRLNRGITAGVAGTWDPVGLTNQGTSENYGAVYSRLVRFACREGMKSVALPELEPDLATAWEQPDPSTLIFKLAPNIKWQNLPPVNGRPFTPADVSYAYNRGKTAGHSVQKSNFALFDAVTALPDGRVQVKLSRPSLTALEVAAQFYAVMVPREIGEDADKAKTTAVGTGAMQVKSQTPNVENVYEKNPDFFKTDAQGRKKPYLDGYTLQIFNDAATISAAFEAKRLDFTYSSSNSLPTDVSGIFDFHKRNTGIVMQMSPSAAASFTLTVHADKPPFNDLRVRKALNMAIPHEQMIKALYKGQGLVAPWFPWPYVLDKTPTTADLGPNYKYDPKEVKALLTAAGFPNGVEWELVYYPTTQPLAVPLQDLLAESGIRLKLQREPDIASIVKRQSAKEWKDLLTFGRGLPFVNPAATWGTYIKGHSQNFSDFTDPKFEELWTKFNAATKAEEQKVLGKEMWTELLAKVPDAPLANAFSLYFHQPTVKNIVNTTWASQVGFGMGQMDSVWRAAT